MKRRRNRQIRCRNRAEQHEHRRYVVLNRIFADCSGGVGREIPLGGLPEEIAISREEAYRIVEFLTCQGFIEYLGAGPRVALTDAGLEYIRHDAGRRRTVR
ncbi:MAG TPA: hypothetical protein VFI91_07430 [Longimicrobiaceae bacterium]|nr:hypothetical protein [Longimicrobiaceae bacterium]